MHNFITLNTPYPKLVQVNEDGVRHYLTPEGLKLPSVTTVLSKSDPNKEKMLAKWRDKIGHAEAKQITNNSAGRGTKLHKIIEKYLKGEPDYRNQVTPDAFAMFLTLKPYLERMDNIYCLEQAMYSSRLGVSGTIDCVGEFDGIMSIIDFKNSRRIRTEEMIVTYFLQATAYALMWYEWRGFNDIKQIVVMMAVENEQPQVFIKLPIDYVKPLLTVIKKYNERNKPC